MNRDALKAATPKTQELDIGEGRTVRIKALSGAGRAAYMKAHKAAEETGGLQPADIAAMALYEDGKLTFDPTNPEDMHFLQELDGAVLDKIAFEFYKLSGLTQNSLEEASKN